MHGCYAKWIRFCVFFPWLLLINPATHRLSCGLVNLVCMALRVPTVPLCSFIFFIYMNYSTSTFSFNVSRMNKYIKHNEREDTGSLSRLQTSSLSSTCLMISPRARLAVRPGDSIPYKATYPGTPWASEPCTIKSPAGCPGPTTCSDVMLDWSD